MAQTFRVGKCTCMRLDMNVLDDVKSKYKDEQDGFMTIHNESLCEALGRLKSGYLIMLHF